MKKTDIEKQDGKLVLKPSAEAQKQREARARLESADAADVREKFTLPELREIMADVLEWMQEGGEA